ncbi:hypothetical protein AYI69_g11317 [Smittium culicis]|uniref:Uncharacterized protein n=1 Tax=Smittium culicis TaxID=133412 RepID=A0A1R1WZN5_9FUNG|nr:hypothetical protein AYI69_g11317 [Smittium culicis]
MIVCATPRIVFGWDSFAGTPLIRHSVRHQFLLEVIGDFPLAGSGTTSVALSIMGFCTDSFSRSVYQIADSQNGVTNVIFNLSFLTFWIVLAILFHGGKQY